MVQVNILSQNITYVDVLNAITDISEKVEYAQTSKTYHKAFVIDDEITVIAHGKNIAKTTDYGSTSITSYSAGYRTYTVKKDGEVVATAKYFIGSTNHLPYLKKRDIPGKESKGHKLAAEKALGDPSLDFSALGNAKQVVKPGEVIGDGYELKFGGGSTFKLGGGNDKAWGGGHYDLLYGGGGADELHGGRGDDRLTGNGGDDKLFGDNGSDSLYGGTGSDRLDGGGGRDRLSGEGGRDKIIFAKGYGKDTVYGFQDRKDTIVLNDNLWKGQKSVRQLLDKFGHQKGSDFVLDFGNNDKLTILRTDKAELFGDVHIV